MKGETRTAQGKWSITIKTPVGEKTGVLDLVIDGSVLSGSLSDAEHFAAIAGSVDGNRLVWSAQVTKPMKMTVKFTALVDADEITGHAKYLLGSTTFRGRRA